MSDRSRPIALLAASLLALVAGTGGAAADDHGSGRALSAICAHEFSLAAARIAEPGSEPLTAVATVDDPGLTDDASDARAGGDVTDGSALGDPPAPDSPPAPAISPDDSLDAAVRACASLQDWLSAAELYPEAFGGLEALDHLVSRCSDPAAGLADYASCQSLAAALATPPPRDPLATPEIIEPAAGIGAEPTAGPRTDPPSDVPSSSNGDDGARAGKRPRAKEAPGGPANVSRDFRATIPGATRVRYFTIRGATPGQLLKQNLRRARAHCRTHRAVACVEMRWTVGVVRDIGAGTCTITRATTKLHATVYLPRWKDRGRAERALRDWWLQVMRESAVHEAKHIKIQRKHLGAFSRAVAGRSCATAERILQRHMKRASKAQAAFDRLEYQKPLPPLPVSLLR